MFTIKVIFFDTETTGLDFRSDSIIELAMLTVEDGTKTDSYDEFIDIGRPISPKISKLTGITNDMIRNEGINEEKVAMDLRERLTEGIWSESLVNGLEVGRIDNCGFHSLC